MEIKEYTEKYNEIAITLIESFAKAKKDENIVFSPMSVIMLLGIAADAVNGKTRDEIKDVIGAGVSYEEFMTVLTKLQAVSAESDSLMPANAVCVKDRIRGSIVAGYEERLKEVFDGKLFTSSDIVHDMNVWVKEKTKGMIEKAAEDSMNQMMACLMNAIAFEAEWMEQYEDDFFTGFLKPYKDEKYSFMALLPKKKEEKSDGSCSNFSSFVFKASR